MAWCMRTNTRSGAHFASRFLHISVKRKSHWFKLYPGFFLSILLKVHFILPKVHFSLSKCIPNCEICEQLDLARKSIEKFVNYIDIAIFLFNGFYDSKLWFLSIYFSHQRIAAFLYKSNFVCVFLKARFTLKKAKRKKKRTIVNFVTVFSVFF